MNVLEILDKIYKSPTDMRRFWKEQFVYKEPLVVILGTLERDEMQFKINFPLTVEDLIDTFPSKDDELKWLKSTLINELTPRCSALVEVLKKYE